MTSGYLTDLADVCRKAGLTVHEVNGWKTRGHGRFVDVDTIVCHHTAGPKAGNMPSLDVVTHGRPGLDGPLCNLGLARDGSVYVVAAGYAWHAGVVRSTTYGNAYSIGIEAEATGTSSWPEVQVEAYARLCKALADHYRVPVSRVLGHKEVCAPVGRKSDPNFDMDAFRRRVAAATNPEELTVAQIDDLKKQLDRIEKLSAATNGSQGRNESNHTRLDNVYRELADLAAKVDALTEKVGTK